MWAVGVYDLRLTDGQFWQLTLKEYMKLADRLLADRERQDYRAALVCTVVANAHRDSKQKPYRPQDFMPKKKRSKTAQEMLEHVKVLHKALGGVGGE